MKSSIFLSNLSVVDHAYINEFGQVIGGSFNPSFIVTGEVDEHEKVVVDFSTIKKELKRVIDMHSAYQQYNGFDHKLWWIEGHSKGMLRFMYDPDLIPQGYYHIVTPALEMKLPVDAVKIIYDQYITYDQPIDVPIHYSPEYIGMCFSNHVTNLLQPKFPDVNLTVKCFNNTQVHLIDELSTPYMFTYVHGLKNSSSYGCVNLSHGHLSFVQVPGNDDLAYKIAKQLNNTILINKENIIAEDELSVTIGYTTEQRGYFEAKYNKLHNKIKIFETETTIEYIASWINDHYNVNNFFVSEGLSKGTYF